MERFREWRHNPQNVIFAANCRILGASLPVRTKKFVVGVNTRVVPLKVYCPRLKLLKFARLVTLNASPIRRSCARSPCSGIVREIRTSTEAKPGPSIVFRPMYGGRSVAVMLLLFGSLPTVAEKWRPL